MITPPVSRTKKQLAPAKDKNDLPGNLYRKAFENSLQANIIFIVSDGRIIRANRAACKLLGYTKKELLTKHRKDVFCISENSYKKMIRERKAEGHTRIDLSLIRKTGKLLPCEVTSVIFKDDQGIHNSILSIVDLRERLLRQQKIDTKNEEIVAGNIIIAQSKSDTRLELEINMKERQIIEAIVEAKETERSDIGKELHDNINQLLGASLLYLDMARKDMKNGDIYLVHCHEYTLTAIEEIRKLTKALTAEAVKDFGLCAAVEDISRDTMETYPVKIHLTLDNSIENTMSGKFKLNVFRILQEQLTNILKHANATRVDISISPAGKGFMVSVKDDGVGFDTTQKKKGIGLNNIISRAELYKGNAHFISSAGKGCELDVSFPQTNAN